MYAQVRGEIKAQAMQSKYARNIASPQHRGQTAGPEGPSTLISNCSFVDQGATGLVISFKEPNELL